MTPPNSRKCRTAPLARISIERKFAQLIVGQFDFDEEFERSQSEKATQSLG